MKPLCSNCCEPIRQISIEADLCFSCERSMMGLYSKGDFPFRNEKKRQCRRCGGAVSADRYFNCKVCLTLPSEQPFDYILNYEPDCEYEQPRNYARKPIRTTPKHCNKCNTTKPLTEFALDHSPKSDGYASYCKDCKRSSWRAHSKKIEEKMRQRKIAAGLIIKMGRPKSEAHLVS